MSLSDAAKQKCLSILAPCSRFWGSAWWCGANSDAHRDFHCTTFFARARRTRDLSLAPIKSWFLTSHFFWGLSYSYVCTCILMLYFMVSECAELVVWRTPFPVKCKLHLHNNAHHVRLLQCVIKWPVLPKRACKVGDVNKGTRSKTCWRAAARPAAWCRTVAKQACSIKTLEALSGHTLGVTRVLSQMQWQAMITRSSKLSTSLLVSPYTSSPACKGWECMHARDT